jgi:hypothetical protein
MVLDHSLDVKVFDHDLTIVVGVALRGSVNRRVAYVSRDEEKAVESL